MVVAATAGWRLGLALAGYPPGEAGVPRPGAEPLRYVLLLSLAGGALGLLVTPYLTVVPLRRLWALAHGADAPTLIGAGFGLLVGLLAAALAAYPISLLPDPFGRWLPTGVALLLAWLGVAIGALRKDEVARAFGRGRWQAGPAGRGEGRWTGPALAVLDTSAIVDGRVVAVRHTGFLGGDLAVPRFVLEELQQLADSADPARRQRGRRGLQLLERLREETDLAVLDVDYPDVRGVDGKLIRLAQQRRAAVVTTDHNLHRVATLQGVPVLDVAELAGALRAPLVPGEELAVEVVQPGRERGQGLAFLEDGTMVVVEGGRRLVGERAPVEVTRVLQTAGGRIVFTRAKDPDPPASPPAESGRAPLPEREEPSRAG
jgi:uncharacterized protein YacL